MLASLVARSLVVLTALTAALCGLALARGFALPGTGIIAFVGFNVDNRDIYLIDIHSGTQARYNVTRHRFEDSSPAWSPDGAQLAFNSFRDGNWEIYVTDLSGREVRRITRNRSIDVNPAWSPDGARIVFERSHSPGSSIFVAAADGGDLRDLARGAANNSPVWSPDGTRIAFVSDRAWPPAIYLMNANSGEVERASEVEVYRSGGLAWSPDGTKIAFSAPVESRVQIFVIELASRRVWQVTHMESAYNSHPAWSPDGRRIVFMSAAGGGSIGASLYVVDEDGSNLRFLTPNGMFPAWRPQNAD